MEHWCQRNRGPLQTTLGRSSATHTKLYDQRARMYIMISTLFLLSKAFMPEVWARYRDIRKQGEEPGRRGIGRGVCMQPSTAGVLSFESGKHYHLPLARECPRLNMFSLKPNCMSCLKVGEPLKMVICFWFPIHTMQKGHPQKRTSHSYCSLPLIVF